MPLNEYKPSVTSTLIRKERMIPYELSEYIEIDSRIPFYENILQYATYHYKDSHHKGNPVELMNVITF